MKQITLILTLFVAFAINAGTLLGTNFTYQGELKSNTGTPLTGSYDFLFVAYDTKNNLTGTVQAQVAVDAVMVDNGVFTTQIDFGDMAFVGDKVWMEINVKTGGSAGGYTQLLPRQEITSIPYAIHAQFVGAGAVSNVEIQDGTITLADLGSNSVNSVKIVDGSVGVNDVDTMQVQSRITGNCSAGSFISSVNEDGTIVCTSNTVLAALITALDTRVGNIEAKDLSNKKCAVGQYVTGFDSNGNPNCGLVSVSRYNVMLCGTIRNDHFQTLLAEIGFAPFTNSCVPSSSYQAMLITRNGAIDPSLDATTIQNYLTNGGIVITEYDGADVVFNLVFGTSVVQGATRYGNCQDNINPQVQFNANDPFWNNFVFTSEPINLTGCGFSVDTFPGITALGGWSAAGTVSLAYRNLGLGRLWLVESDWQDNSSSLSTLSKDMMKYMILHRN